MNLDVFPRGYIAGYEQRNPNKPAQSLKIMYQVKRGVTVGPATIFIDKKRVCKTQFSEQIEFIKTRNHPIGTHNMLSSDSALLNCLLVLLFIASIVMIEVMDELAYVWVTLAVFFYSAQLIEAVRSQTIRLLC